MTVKVKFLQLATEEAKQDDGEEVVEEPTYRVRFTKKKGNIMDWYEMQ